MSWVGQTLNNVDVLTVNFVQAMYTTLAVEMGTVIKGGIVLYFSILGILTIRGEIDTPLKEIAKRAIFAGIVTQGLLNWDVVSHYANDFVFKAPNEIGIKLLQAVSSANSNAIVSLPTDATGMGDVIDTIIYQMTQIISEVSDKSVVWGIIVGLAMTALMIFLIGISMGLLIFAKVALAFIVGLVPLFSLALFFKSTKGLFEGLMRALWMTWLLPILIYSVLAFVFFVTDQMANTAINKINGQNSFDFGYIVPLFILYGCGTYLMFQVKDLAYGITGGFQMSGNAVKGLAAGAAGKVISRATQNRSARKAAIFQEKVRKHRENQRA